MKILIPKLVGLIFFCFVISGCDDVVPESHSNGESAGEFENKAISILNIRDTTFEIVELGVYGKFKKFDIENCSSDSVVIPFGEYRYVCITGRELLCGENQSKVMNTVNPSCAFLDTIAPGKKFEFVTPVRDDCSSNRLTMSYYLIPEDTSISHYQFSINY